MMFHVPIEDLDDSFVPGALGVPETKENREAGPSQLLCHIIVLFWRPRGTPGVFFDSND